MKKIICIAFSLALLLFALTVPVFAAGTESENNDTAAKANPIRLGETCTGNIASRTDEDWYRFTLSAPGNISVSFTHEIYASTSSYWCLQIFESDGISGVLGFDALWNVAGSENLQTVHIGLDQGTYYIRVSPYATYSFQTGNYRLTVNYTASDAWETENNSTFETADTIALNKDITGTIGGNKDVDWYCFTLDSDGSVYVDFSHGTVANDSVLWEMHLYRSNGVTGLHDGDSYWEIRGSENMLTCSIGLEKGVYYIKVEPYSTYRYDVTAYTLNVHFTSSAVWEKESNDSYEKATDVPLNTDFYGSMMDGKDTDWYRFTLTEASEVTLSFTHPISATTNTLWNIYLYGANGTTGIVGAASNARVSGSENFAFPPVYLAAGTYYIKICTYSSYTYSSETYTLRLSSDKVGICETEPNGDFSTATEIQPEKEYLGSLLVYNDIDCYKFTLDKKSSARIVFYRKNDHPTKIELTVYKSDGTTRVGSTVWFEGSAPLASVGYETLDPGTYYIKIEPYSSYQPALEPYGIAVLLNHEHTPDGKWTVTTKPDCTSEGIRQCTCTVCGGVCESTVPAEGHSFGEWQEQRAPGCTFQGTRYRSCTQCYYYETENLPALGHDYGGWVVTREATCEAKGREESVCSRCGDIQFRDTAILEHVYGTPERIKGNIFNYPIVYRKKCVNCGHRMTYEDNKARWAAPVIIVGGILLLAAAVLIIVLSVKKKKKASAAARAYAQNVQPPVSPGAPGAAETPDGSITCSCGGVNPPDAVFCTCCGKRLR